VLEIGNRSAILSGQYHMSFPVIDGKYIKLEFKKEFKKFIPQFLRILF